MAAALQKLLCHVPRTPEYLRENVSARSDMGFSPVCALVSGVDHSLLTHSKSWIAVDGLDEFFTLMAHHPVRVILGRPFGIQRNHLEAAEISLADIDVFGTDVIDVWHVVMVKIIFASIPSTIT